MTLSVHDLHYTYAGWPPTLRGISFEVPAGASGFLLGPSGSGKSTLLRCIAGLLPDYQGAVRWDDELLDGLPPHKRQVGMLFQEPALFPHLDVLHNVAFGLRYRGVRRSERAVEAQHWLDVVELGEKRNARVDQLSGGQRQRVALARTLAAKPRVVLLDEPFGSLDRDLRESLGPKVQGILHEQGVAALWVTHDRDEALRLGDRVWRLDDAGRAHPVDGSVGR